MSLLAISVLSFKAKHRGFDSTQHFHPLTFNTVLSIAHKAFPSQVSLWGQHRVYHTKSKLSLYSISKPTEQISNDHPHFTAFPNQQKKGQRDHPQKRLM